SRPKIARSSQKVITMSENRLPSPEPSDNSWLYPQWRHRFRRDLITAGFGFQQILSGVEYWTGRLDVSWDDPASGEQHLTYHAGQIARPSAFPFARPAVFPIDPAPPIRDSRHQAPHSDSGPLCLWPTDQMAGAQR